MADETILCDTSTTSELLRGGSRTTAMRGLFDAAIKAISVLTIAQMKWGSALRDNVT